jgi:hypothetical protein
MSQLSSYQRYLPLVKEAFRRNKALIASVSDTSIGRCSSWRGRSVGRYIERIGQKLTVSGPFPADFTHGYLIDPRANLLDGNSPIRHNLRESRLSR